VSTKKLILVGSRANLTDIVYTARDLGYEVIGILDKHYWGNTNSIDNVPLIGSEEELLSPGCKWKDYSFFLANWWDGSQDLSGQGNNGGELRKQRIDILETSGVEVINLIHPTAVFFHKFDTVKIGKGNLILGHAKFTSHISIGNYSVIDWDCNIGTGTSIGDNVIVGATTTTAHVIIDDHVRIGVGSILIPKKNPTLTIGKNSIVYIGSTVLENVPADSVYNMYNKIRSRITKRENENGL
jgi:acetyltransferase-like isoleucine patch superfamily enzyme